MMGKPVRIAIALLTISLASILIWLLVRSNSTDPNISKNQELRLLFIGNSFTSANALDQLAANLFAELLPDKKNIVAKRVAPGGQTLAQHQENIANPAQNSPLRKLLVDGPEATQGWDLIVLQGQSQIPGLSQDFPEKAALLQAAPLLHRHTRATGATTMLFMTWGYAEGDAYNPNRYPDYLTMQAKLTQGYENLASHMSTPEDTVFIAPVGLGFQLIYQDLKTQGKDPLAPNSLFRQLYAADNKHPSLAGSYLTACVIIAAYTGRRTAPATWVPKGLDPAIASSLRQVADRLVLDDALFPDWYHQYPF